MAFKVVSESEVVFSKRRGRPSATLLEARRELESQGGYILDYGTVQGENEFSGIPAIRLRKDNTNVIAVVE